MSFDCVSNDHEQTNIFQQKVPGYQISTDKLQFILIRAIEYFRFFISS